MAKYYLVDNHLALGNLEDAERYCRLNGKTYKEIFCFSRFNDHNLKSCKHCKEYFEIHPNNRGKEFCGKPCRTKYQKIKYNKRKRPDCPRPDKVAFGSLETAEDAIPKLVLHFDDIETINVYECRCGFFHIGNKVDDDS